jgi:hypothetical protein
MPMNSDKALSSAASRQGGESMSDFGISGIGNNAWSSQEFGARTVSGTLDAMNRSGPMNAAPVDRQTFGAAVVSKTLDYMNTDRSGAGSFGADYDFQKSVLGAWASGAILNNIV